MGCKREERELRPNPPVLAALEEVALMPVGIGGARGHDPCRYDQL